MYRICGTLPRCVATTRTPFPRPPSFLPTSFLYPNKSIGRPLRQPSSLSPLSLSFFHARPFFSPFFRVVFRIALYFELGRDFEERGVGLGGYGERNKLSLALFLPKERKSKWSKRERELLWIGSLSFSPCSYSQYVRLRGLIFDLDEKEVSSPPLTLVLLLRSMNGSENEASEREGGGRIASERRRREAACKKNVTYTIGRNFSKRRRTHAAHTKRSSSFCTRNILYYSINRPLLQ